MVPKHVSVKEASKVSFRAVLFRMVPKLPIEYILLDPCFRAVLFRMVPKRLITFIRFIGCFRAVLFRMVPKHAST